MEVSGTDAAGRGRTKRAARGLRTAASRMPMRWIGLVGTGIVLLSTAAFGGLEPAPKPPIPVVSAGQEYVSDQMTFTVQRAGLLEPSYINEDEPSEYLVVEVLARNTDPEYMWSSSDGALGKIRVDGADDLGYTTYARVGESRMPVLQPLVPATVQVRWEVPQGDFAVGDSIRVVLPEATPEQMFTSSAIRWDVTDGAYVDVTLEDLGSERDEWK